MRKRNRQAKRPSSRKFFSAWLSSLCFLLLLIFCLVGWVGAEEPKTQPTSGEINGILAGLDDSYSQVKAEALNKLSSYNLRQLNHPGIVSKVTGVLKDPAPDVRAAAAIALGKMENIGKGEVKALVALLKDPNYSVSATAAEALGETKENALGQVSAIATFLKDPNPFIRAAALEALGGFGNVAKGQVTAIATFLKDPHPRVRAAAVFALGAFGDVAKGQVAAIANLLQDPNPFVRAAAAQALGAMGNVAKGQVAAIANLLQDPNYTVSAAAAQALGQMGDVAKGQVAAIVTLLQDPNYTVSAAAAQALGEMGNVAKGQVTTIGTLLQHSEPDVSAVAAQALGEMGNVAAGQVGAIANLLQDPQPDVRAAAAQALGEMGNVASGQVKAIANLLQDPQPDVRAAAAQALGEMGDVAKGQVKAIATLLQDRNYYVRYTAAQALGEMGDVAKGQVKAIATLLQDPDYSVRVAAAQALEAIAPPPSIETQTLLQVLNSIYGSKSELGKLRFAAHFLSGGKQETQLLMKWIGLPKEYPDKISYAQGVKTLNVFAQIWDASASLPKLRGELEKQIAVVANMVKWERHDVALLQRHYNNLKIANSIQAASVQNVIVSLIGWRWLTAATKTMLTHAALWLALLFAYPKSLFFWNRWVRKTLGLGYVGFALTWVPFLRRKLLAPFQEALRSDASLQSFDQKAYFPDSEVKATTWNDSQPARAIIPDIIGQIVLVGDSGLGKTMFLRHLVKKSQRIVVYLPAWKCDRGVVEAIQDLLPTQAKDSQFLRHLIDRNTIDICIDGLSEVTTDTREKVTEFVEFYYKGNIIIATRPLEWTPPSMAKIYIMQPLKRSQIERFLVSRFSTLPQDVQVPGSNYEQTCRNYLNEALSEQQPAEQLATATQILSNPRNLTLVAQILARGEQPNLFRLQQ